MLLELSHNRISQPSEVAVLKRNLNVELQAYSEK